MRTKRIKLYKFNELSESAKEKAIENFRQDEDYGYLYDEAHESVKVFHEIFGTTEGRNSWLDCRFENIEDNVLELKGLRLRKYIINNFWQYLFKGKYYSKGKYTYVNPNNPNDYKYEYKSRYSKVIFDNACTLTGVCYDNSLLQPIYDFLQYKDKPDYYSYLDFETLMNDCFDSLKKDLENEVESRNEDEYVIEQIEANDYEFLKNGEMSDF